MRDPIKETVDELNKYVLNEKVSTLTDQQLQELTEFISTVWQERVTLDVGKVFKDPEDSYFIDYYLCTAVVNGKRVGIGFSLGKCSSNITLSQEEVIPDDYMKVDHIDIKVGKLIESVVLPFTEYMNKWKHKP